jgi:hypothetical protein
VKRLIVLLVLVVSPGLAGSTAQNWSGEYLPCNHHLDLMNRGHMDLGVRIATSNPALAQQFTRALEFWRSVLDFDWHLVDSQACSIQLVDGTPDIFSSPGTCTCISARSQLPDLPAFQGWIAFNPRLKLTDHEMFLISVHEIGHLLGLPHSSNGSSVMFFLDLDEPVSLDRADLHALADRHTLREAGSGLTRITVPTD